MSALPLVFGGRSVHGSLPGTPIDCEDTLRFSVLESIRPMIETIPLERAADAMRVLQERRALGKVVIEMPAPRGAG